MSAERSTRQDRLAGLMTGIALASSVASQPVPGFMASSYEDQLGEAHSQSLERQREQGHRERHIATRKGRYPERSREVKDTPRRREERGRDIRS